MINKIILMIFIAFVLIKFFLYKINIIIARTIPKIILPNNKYLFKCIRLAPKIAISNPINIT